VGEFPLYFYIPMFPWKDFLMGWIRKIQKYKGGKGQIRKFQKKKTRRKEWRKEKEEFFYIHGGSHTRVFSID
jgi:hypothetical protein